MKKLKPYLERNARLIQLEADQERLDVEERRAWTPEMLAAEGIVLTGLEGYWLKQQNGKEKESTGVDPPGDAPKKRRSSPVPSVLSKTAVLQRPGKAKLGWTKLQQGDYVELRDERNLIEHMDVQGGEESASKTSEKRPPAIAVIRAINDYEIRLAFKEPLFDINLVECPSWRVDLAYNDTIEERLQASVKALAHDVGATHRAGSLLSGSHLVDLLLEPASPEITSGKGEGVPAPIASWIHDNCAQAPAPDMSPLSATQQKAVELMLRDRISLIQGPPGTGKTSTIVAAIRVLKQHYKIPHNILLTSHTNVAVDNLTQGCKNAGLRVVRAGPIARVRESLLDVTIDGLMEKHPEKSRLDDIDALRIATIKALQVARRREERADTAPSSSSDFDSLADVGEDDQKWELGASEVVSELGDSAYASMLASESPSQLQRRLSRLIQRAFLIRREIEADILTDADVVCCTALSAPLLQAVDFPMVFFDEATMATEPITIAAMIKGCQQLSLIGDHKQLSPLIRNRQSKDENLGDSLFERLMERGDIESIMLDTQHRMHPALAAFPGREFYAGQLHNGTATNEIKALRTSFAVQSADGSSATGYLNFIHHAGRERFSRGDKSLENKTDADVVVRVLADLLVHNPELKGSDIAIVTPYAGQKELLSRALYIEQQSHLRRLLVRELELRGGQSARARMREASAIEIETIDGFEGREKRAIIFSLTRSNGAGYMGFLNEHKRWNVALTRARSGLFIVGNIDMLEKARMADAHSPTGRHDEMMQEEVQLPLAAAEPASATSIEHAGFLGRLAAHLRKNGCVIDAKDLLSPDRKAH